MTEKKVLYISYDGMTDPLGQSQVLPYLAGLSKEGYQFTILSFEKKKRYKKEAKIIHDICAAIGVKWRPVFFTKNPPILSKVYDRWKMRRKAKQLHDQFRFDMIHCRSYIAAEAGLELKRKTGVKFFFDMRGFWADEKVDNGQWNQKRLLFRKIYGHYKKKEKEFLLNADAIISLTHAAKNEILEKDVYRHLMIEVIPCCADLAHFNWEKVHEEDKSTLRKELQIAGNNKVITYLGSVGGWYMTKEMFSFFRCLLQQHPEFIIMMLTKDDPESVKAEAALEGIPGNRLIVTYCPRKQLPLYLSLSDCSIFFIRPTYSKIASSPTKHAELMGMGVPVICNAIGDTGHIIEETKTGLVVKDFSKQSYLEVIDKMPQLLTISKKYIRQNAFQYFDLEKGTQAYVHTYRKVLKTDSVVIDYEEKKSIDSLSQP